MLHNFDVLIIYVFMNTLLSVNSSSYEHCMAVFESIFFFTFTCLKQAIVCIEINLNFKHL